MPDGKLKLLDMYTKVTEMTKHLAQDANDRQYFDMEYFRFCQAVTAMCAGANKLYGDSAGGKNNYDTYMGVEELKKNYEELHAGLKSFKDRYMSETNAPNGPLAQMLRELENDMQEDREVLRTMDLQPGMSLMHAVYESQKKMERDPNERVEEPELPGYDTVHQIDYPGFETLHGVPREAPAEPELPPEDYPTEATLRMQEGNVGPAVRPYENVVYGTDTFYRNEMDLPTAEEVKREDIRNQRKTSKSLQIWTIAPLTNAIADATARTDPAASGQMLKINMSLQALFNTIYPFNPKTGEQAKVPTEQDVAEIRLKTGQAQQQLRQWKEAYLQNNPEPSEQVLFMADNALKKLEDDDQVVSGILPGETLPEAAFRSSRLPKHFGLRDDRKTPLPAPEKQRAESVTQVQEPGTVQQSAPEEEQVPSPTELYQAFYELQGIQDAMVKADPKWMLSSSGAYGDMRKSIEGTIKFVLKNRDVFSSTPDPSSPEYQKAAKEFMKRLNTSRGKTASYLDKKAVDLEKDDSRKEDPGKQKWEQRRILTALTSYDKLSELCNKGRVTAKDPETDARIADYRQSLLSEKSREAQAAGNDPPEAGASAPIMQ